jgi:enoyl-CoA hydratase/carnithine racemase
VTDAHFVTVADLAARAAADRSGLGALDDTGLVDDPLLLVDLDSAEPPGPVLDGAALRGDVRADTIARAADGARSGGRLFVGVTSRLPSPALRPLLAALDVTLVPAGVDTGAALRECVGTGDPRAAAEALASAAANAPQAALVLAQVLRATESLPVSAALDVESFAYSMLLGGAEFRRWLTGRGARPQPASVAEPVRVRRDEERLHVTLNRPERRNAFGRQLRDALTDALRVALLDPGISRVLLDGAGAAFCAGGDLAEFGTAPDLVTAHFVRTLGGAGRLVSELGERIEVHLHGPCVGAGIELPAFAGTVVAAPGTTFTLPEVRMGLIPGAGGTVSIPRRAGRWRTLYLALTGQPIDTGTALSWGLIDQLAADAIA